MHNEVETREHVWLDYLSMPFWNRREARLRSLVRIVLLFILLSLWVTVGGVIGFILDFPGKFIFLGVLPLPATFISMWLAGRFLDHRPFADFGFHINKNWFMDLVFGLALGAFLMTGIFLVQWVAGWVTVTDTFYVASGRPFAVSIIPSLVFFLSVGIYEEMLSRGYLLLNLAEGVRFRFIRPQYALILAWVLSSALFGLGHIGNPNTTVISTINLILAGVFLGLGFVLTGELAIPIGLHITWNFFQGNVYGFPVSGVQDVTSVTFVATEQGGPAVWTGGNFGPEAGLLGILAIATGCVLIALWVRWRYGQVAFATLKWYNTPDNAK